MPTPEEWRDTLIAKLEKRALEVGKYESYYEGDHNLAFATPKFREAFGNLFAAFSDNWCGVVVDAAVERLNVQGFRFGESPDADDEAWQIWQANDLDAESIVAQETAVATGYGYLLVSPPERDGDQPLITVEHPLEVICAHDPANRRIVRAALKKWVDDDGFLMATLYLPDQIHKWRSEKRASRVTSLRTSQLWWPGQEETTGPRVRWMPRGDGQYANPVGEVTMIPLLNRPTMRGAGRSDLKSVIPEQDAVNKLTSDMLVASEFAAFRQRWAAGIEVPTDPDTGKPIRKVFDAAVDRIFSTANEDAKFGSFDATDLSNYVGAVEMVIQHIAAQTRTPPHYLLGQSGSFPSGESLKATETGLVARVRRKMTTFGEAYETAMRLAFKIKGDPTKANALDAETIWRDPESRSEAELVDGLVKLATIGVPKKALWARLGASPQEIKQWETMAAADTMEQANADFVRFNGTNGQGVPNEQPQGPGQGGQAPAGSLPAG